MRWIIIAGLPVLLLGCATITRGTTQSIAINTPNAPGASCTLASSSVATQTIVTPATVTVNKGNDSIKVSCRKECFTDGAGVVTSNVEEMAAGNVLVGGVVGLGVDMATGAINKYNTDTSIHMTPIPGCRPRTA